MDPILNTFIRQYAGVVMATLAPVVLVAFMAMPFSLGYHPGEAQGQACCAPIHGP
jgi:hypothetical protein